MFQNAAPNNMLSVERHATSRIADISDSQQLQCACSHYSFDSGHSADCSLDTTLLQQSADPVQAGGSHGVTPPPASYTLRETPRLRCCGEIFVLDFGYQGDAESTVCCVHTALHKSMLYLLSFAFLRLVESAATG